MHGRTHQQFQIRGLTVPFKRMKCQNWHRGNAHCHPSRRVSTGRYKYKYISWCIDVIGFGADDNKRLLQVQVCNPDYVILLHMTIGHEWSRLSLWNLWLKPLKFLKSMISCVCNFDHGIRLPWSLFCKFWTADSMFNNIEHQTAQTLVCDLLQNGGWCIMMCIKETIHSDVRWEMQISYAGILYNWNTLRVRCTCSCPQR